jgi:hypothetical protein
VLFFYTTLVLCFIVLYGTSFRPQADLDLSTPSPAPPPHPFGSTRGRGGGPLLLSAGYPHTQYYIETGVVLPQPPRPPARTRGRGDRGGRGGGVSPPRVPVRERGGEHFTPCHKKGKGFAITRLAKVPPPPKGHPHTKK